MDLNIIKKDVQKDGDYLIFPWPSEPVRDRLIFYGSVVYRMINAEKVKTGIYKCRVRENGKIIGHRSGGRV